MRRRHLSPVVTLGVVTGLLFAPTATAHEVESDSFLLSVKTTTTLDQIGGGDVTVKNEDVVLFLSDQGDDGAYELFIDGSDVDIDGAIDAFTIWPEGGPEGEDLYLMSFAADEELEIDGGDVEVDDADVVAFHADSLGPDTDGEFTLFLTGEEIGLTTSGEDIDAIEFELEDEGGGPVPHLYFSTTGDFSIPNPGFMPSPLKGQDEDIVHCHLTASDPDDDGDFVCEALFIEFDGTESHLFDSGEDIDAFGFEGGFDLGGLGLVISTAGDLETPTAAGQDEDLFNCNLGGDCDDGDFFLWFTGDNNGIKGDVTAIHTQCVEIPDFDDIVVSCAADL